MPLKVLITVAGLFPETGGLSRSVPGLCEILAGSGVDVEILSLDYGTKFGRPLLPAAGRVTLANCQSAFRAGLRWSPEFGAILRQRCRAAGVQIVHDNCLWLLTNHSAATVCRKLKVPRLVSPRGTLTPWALRHRGWKKKIAWLLYQRKDLFQAQALHATSTAEVENCIAAGLKQPIALIPNGVELPPWEERLKPGSTHRTLLFLGRLHPIKGLPDLVRAWAAIRPQGWRVVIAGGDEQGYRAEVEAAVRAQGVEADFVFKGTVDGAAKWDLYRQADVFVLPSYTENFGLVIAEALACGVPAIATHGAPWKDLETHQCGWWIAAGPDSLAAALQNAFAKSDEERREMGRRGRQLVETKDGWPRTGAQMLAVYQWMLAQGSKPDCMVQ